MRINDRYLDKTYTKVKAMQFTGDNFMDIQRWSLNRVRVESHSILTSRYEHNDHMEMRVFTLGGKTYDKIEKGDWIVMSKTGRVSIIPEEVFIKNYTQVI